MPLHECMQHFCRQPGAARTSLSDTVLRHGGRGGVVSRGAQRAARLRQRAAVRGLARAQALDLALGVAQRCLHLRAWAQAWEPISIRSRYHYLHLNKQTGAKFLVCNLPHYGTDCADMRSRECCTTFLFMR
jgi:hypothetical protein